MLPALGIRFASHACLACQLALGMMGMRLNAADTSTLPVRCAAMLRKPALDERCRGGV